MASAPLDDPEGPVDLLATIRRTLGDSTGDRAWAQGQVMTLDEAVQLAVSAEWEGSPAQSSPRVERSALTQREQEVAVLVARGLSNRQIAETLVFGERTAEAHVAHCLAKLGLGSRAELAAWAVAHGLLGATAPTVRT